MTKLADVSRDLFLPVIAVLELIDIIQKGKSSLGVPDLDDAFEA